MTGGRLRSTLTVLRATLSGVPPGAQARAVGTDRLRRWIHVGPPLNAQVSYLMSGDGAGAGVHGGAVTRVVLVHGTPGSAQTWAPYLLAPPPGLQLVALDRPGFGRSGPAGAVPSLVAQAAAVAAVLPADRRSVLVGHSLGGAIVTRVAAQHPQRVGAVVLLAASLDPALERIHLLQPLGSRWPMRLLLPRAIRNANAELMALRTELERLAWLLPCVTAPLFVVHGTADALVPVANVDYIESRLAFARRRHVVLLPGANHFLPGSAERAVRAAIGMAAAARPC